MIEQYSCPFFGKCGGCSTDESYRDQLSQKQERIEDLLSYFGRVYPIIGAQKPLYYRNKVNWEYSVDKKGHKFNGLYEEGGHIVVPVEQCFLHDKCAQSVIDTVNEYFDKTNTPYFNEFTGEGFLRHVLIRRSPSLDQTMVVLVTGMWKFQHKDEFIDFVVKRHPDVVSIVQNRNNQRTSMILSDDENRILYGPGYIEDKMLGLKFRISPSSFAQVNPYQAAELYSVAMDMAHLNSSESVIDAYCGTGTIGLIAAANGAGRVVGIENNLSAIEDANNNALINGISNADFVCADASEYMKKMAKEGNSADVVFLDPPRSGTDERFLASVFRLNPKRIVYISCNPYTLNRDLRYISNFSNYRVCAIQPVDMFPYTDHVEVVVMMSRVN